MFYKFSKFFLYASLITPLLLIKAMFFPFIAGKAITFRVLVELALLFFLFHILAHFGDREFFARLIQKLKHPIVICVAIFAVMITVTALIGVNPTQSFWSNFERGDGAFQILHYAIFFILAFLQFTERKSLERFLIVNIAVSIPICLYALLQLVTEINSNNWFVIAPGDRVSGTLGNPSYLAAYLLFIIAFLIYFFIKNKDMVWRLLLGMLLAFEFFIFLKTGTRGAFLGMIVALLVFAIIHFFITNDKRWRLGLGIFFGTGTMLIIIFFASHSSPIWKHVPVLNRLINFSSAVNDIKPRIWTWGSGLAGAIEKPVAGWGIENFAAPFDKYYNPRHYGIESFFDRTHNIFLEYSISGGLLVLLPWLAIFFFYYRELRKRAKDMWYSVLFVIPIAYLIQGFFLFDTLPIYLAFFAFLVLFLNSDENEIHLSPNENSALVGANIATATILTLGVIGLLYYTAFLPFQKNRLIVNALLLQNTLAAQAAAGVKQTINPVEIVDAFHQALAFKSPIGQEEAVAMYQKFMLNIVENASQNEKVTSSPQARQEMKQVLDDVNKVFDDNLPIYAGLKQHFINGGINMRAGLAFNLPEYLARGKKTFTESLEKSPTRLEFIRVLIQLAQLQNDKEALEKWARRANLYRPDIFKLEELLPTAGAK